jgi:transposase
VNMAKPLVPDELWEVIEPLLPKELPKPKGGRPRVSDRAALAGIIFVLKSGIPWEMLPQEMGCGCGMTCWRRLEEWHEAGVWECLHRRLCWTAWGRRTRSTGRAPRWTRQRCRPPGGRKSRAESDG